MSHREQVYKTLKTAQAGDILLVHTHSAYGVPERNHVIFLGTDTPGYQEVAGGLFISGTNHVYLDLDHNGNPRPTIGIGGILLSDADDYIIPEPLFWHALRRVDDYPDEGIVSANPDGYFYLEGSIMNPNRFRPLVKDLQALDTNMRSGEQHSDMDLAAVIQNFLSKQP